MSDNDLHHFDEEDDGPPSWLVTFADMSLLLLTFFLLLFAMSNLDQLRFKKSFLSVRKALGVEERGEGFVSVKIKSGDEGVILSEVQAHRQLVEEQKKVFSDLNFYYTSKGLDGVVGAYLESGTITIRIPGDVLFPSGEVELSDAGKDVLASLRDFFVRHHDQTINIRGHSDDVLPTGEGRYKDNWEISSMRAVTVLRYFMDMGFKADRLTATGLADLQPLFPNTSEENRARNRRVEIVLEKKIGGGM